MRAIGTLNLNFGLINITFKVNSFLETNDLSLRQLCPKCKSPISYKRFCGTCQKEVEYSQLLSGFEISKDNIVVVDKKALSFECQTKIIAIVDIDSEYEFMPKKFYLLTPKDVEKPYFLLLNILTKTNKEIVIEFSLRKKIHLGIIKPVVVNGYRFLMLKTIIYSDSIRDISPLKECEIGEDELNLGLELLKKINDTIPKVNFLQMKDNRKEILAKMIGGEIKPTETEMKQATEDIETLLKKSLEEDGKSEKKMKKAKR